MANSQNGWPVVPNTDAGRAKLADLVLPGGPMDHTVRVLAGDVETIAQWHVREYHQRVEKIESAGCWGWNVRKIGDGPDWSNHASATAWDLNAPDNPDGVPTSKVMTSAQIAECHALERESNGVLRWGGDWGDPDAMHWEINGSKAAVAAFAKKIRDQEEDMPTAADVVDEMMNRVMANNKKFAACIVDTERRTGSLENVRGPKIDQDLTTVKGELNEIQAEQATMRTAFEALKLQSDKDSALLAQIAAAMGITGSPGTPIV
jgi:hypothetical protein